VSVFSSGGSVGLYLGEFGVPSLGPPGPPFIVQGGHRGYKMSWE